MTVAEREPASYPQSIYLHMNWRAERIEKNMNSHL